MSTKLPTYIVPRVMVIESFTAGKPQGKFNLTLLESDLGEDFKSGEYRVTLEKLRKRRKR